MTDASKLIERLREESLIKAGSGINNGCVDCSLLGVLTDEAADALEAAQAEIQRCHERLEINHVWRIVTEADVPEGEDYPVEKIEIPYEERMTAYDGIACRDATIEGLEGQLAAAQEQIERLERDIAGCRHYREALKG